MPLRLTIIPGLLLLAALVGAITAWRVGLPSPPTQSSMEKMKLVEAYTNDPQVRWGKALEIVDAEAGISEAANATLQTGLDLYRWSALFVGALMALQLRLTYEWWKKNSNK